MRRPGFTLVEIMIVIALAVIMFSVSFPFLTSFRSTQSLRTLSDDVMRTLVLARHRAQTNEQDTAWGVKILSNSYVLYAGDSYATRNETLDGLQTFSTAFLLSGLSEVAFQKSTGKTDTTGTITITHVAGETKVITVNSVGGLQLE